MYFGIYYNTKYISAQRVIHHDMHIYEFIYNNIRNKQESDYSTIRVVNIDDNIKSILL